MRLSLWATSIASKPFYTLPGLSVFARVWKPIRISCSSPFEQEVGDSKGRASCSVVDPVARSRCKGRELPNKTFQRPSKNPRRKHGIYLISAGSCSHFSAEIGRYNIVALEVTISLLCGFFDISHSLWEVYVLQPFEINTHS